MSDTRVPTSSPARRLEASRARLRTALQSARDGARDEAGDDGTADDPSTSVIDLLLRGAQRLWTRHPLRSALRVARRFVGPALAAELRPLARSHPLGLVVIGVGAGAALAWLRPWRALPWAALLSLALPRRALWDELMSSGLLDRLARGELMSQWFGAASPQGSTGNADRAEAPSAAAGPEVLHQAQPPADAARAA